MHSRRMVLGGISAALAGCVNSPFSGPGGSQPATDTPSPDAGTETPPTECNPPTPEPTPEFSIANRRAATVTATVTITSGRTATPDGEPVFEETVTVAPGAYADRFDVFPAAGSYVVRVELDDGTTVMETVDASPDDRRSLVTVTVDDGIAVGILDVVPPATPTTCNPA